jgi:hypothetical protein
VSARLSHATWIGQLSYRLPEPLVHQDGGTEGVQRILKECEVVGAPEQRTPWITTVSTIARAEQRSHRSAAIRCRDPLTGVEDPRRTLRKVGCMGVGPFSQGHPQYGRCALTRSNRSGSVRIQRDLFMERIDVVEELRTHSRTDRSVSFC